MFVIIPISYWERKTHAFCTMQNFIQKIELLEIFAEAAFHDYQEQNVKNIHNDKADKVGLCGHSCVERG